MFVVVVVEDKVWLFPKDFANGGDQTAEWENTCLMQSISSRYADRVIPDCGLCISLYDMETIGDAVIHPADNKTFLSQAEFNVVFRLVVFRPFIGEWLDGTILSSNEHGIQASIGFFNDIHIGSSHLMEPSVYARGIWTWLYRDDEGGKPVKFFYEIGSAIRFKVVGLVYGENRIERDGKDPLLKVLAAMNESGLGCTTWW
eukprot:GEMP01009519.1.p1 GENE.GEMP01009519.1~~GEMP01009519.1.p1  ORF type:complete len:201 (+),score=26.11 GEMP01009519.1:100-702(+)